jgi:hypothetical protein
MYLTDSKVVVWCLFEVQLSLIKGTVSVKGDDDLVSVRDSAIVGQRNVIDFEGVMIWAFRAFVFVELS